MGEGVGLGGLRGFVAGMYLRALIQGFGFFFPGLEQLLFAF